MMSMYADSRPESPDIMAKVLAWIAFFALGLAAFLDTIIAALMVFGGKLIGAFSDLASTHEGFQQANRTALIVKLVGAGFGAIAVAQSGAGHLIRRRIRSNLVPVAMAMTVAGWVGISIWIHAVSVMGVIVLCCSAFASWVWWKLPRASRKLDAA
jgi:hypothetical protein